MNNTLLWLRAESKAFEERTLLTPAVTRELLKAGYEVVVERSVARIFDDEDYQEAGCRLVPEGSWQAAPAHAFILGLKELDPVLGPFTRRHVHFAHVYKHQNGWQETLTAFARGKGTLYDLEYLVDDQGRRVAAFGYWAGFVGAATAVLAWAGQTLGKEPSLPALQAWPDKNALVAEVREQLAQALSQVKEPSAAVAEPGSDASSAEHPDESAKAGPRALVIGALGRCGRGACELLEACNVPVTRWDQAETAAGGPFDAVLEHELLVNCVFVNAPSQPFTTREHLQSASRRLSVIADVSCDPTGEFNPLPVYQDCTTMDKPVERLLPATAAAPALDIIAIDHLPSLLPRESSEDFSSQMLPHLLGLKEPDAGVWSRAEAVFRQYRDLALGQ